MRILANYAEKVSTGNYENQTYTVTFEAETEFNNIERVVDYLFHQAKEAVERQKSGTGNPNLNAGNGKRAAKKQNTKATAETPKAETPATKNGEKKEAATKGNGKTPVKAETNGKKNGKIEKKEEPKTQPTPTPTTPPQSEPFPITDAQTKMLYRLAKELGNATDADAKKFLCDGAEALTGKKVTSVKELSRKNASRLIEKLLEMQRKAA